MLRLLLNILLLLLLVFGGVEVLFRLDPLKQQNIEGAYLASLIDKHRRLDSLSSPRLLLQGGSSMAYGTDSRLLEDTLRLPVQNMATQIVLGTRFMLNELRPSLRRGDVLLLGFEYHITSYGDTEQQLMAAEYYPSAKQFIDYQDIKQSLTAPVLYRFMRLRYLAGALMSGTTNRPNVADTVSVFFRRGFSAEGDLLSHLNNSPIRPLQHNVLPSDTDWSGIVEDLRVFCAEAQQRGVRVLYAHPPYARSAYTQNQATISRLAKSVEAVPHLVVLGRPQDFVYDDSLFFDSVYHLNAQGRHRRSVHLADLLKPYVNP